MKRSLVTRVLLAAGAVLMVFLGLTVTALDFAFRSASERAIRERLQVHALALISAAGQDVDGNLLMPRQLPEPRFSNPGSGLYAQILDADGEPLWRSASMAGVSLLIPEQITPGGTLFERVTVADGIEVFQYGFSVRWHDGASGQPRTYHFAVAETLEPYLAQLARYRTSLLGWFAVLFAALVASQLLILRRTLRPLRRLAAEVAAVEHGERDRIEGQYPRELQHLARNLNAVVRNERGNLARHRNTLADLAHSLKTPLAVIRFALDAADPKRDETIERQVERMNDIVRFQLQRALAAGGATFGKPVAVAPAVREIAASLAKVYAARGLEFEAALAPEASFRGERSELLELLGTLLDNAFKWARTRVRVTVTAGLRIEVEDDGPGIPAEQRGAVLGRGIRADETVDGQGIGLAIAADIVARRGGTLALTDSELGGLRAVLEIP